MLAGDALHQIEIKNDKAKQRIPAATAAIGDKPGRGRPSRGGVFVYAGLGQRIEVGPGSSSVKFHHEAEGKPGSFEFSVADNAHAPEIARAAVERAGLPADERSEDITVVEAVMPPIILGAICGFVWMLIYMAAVGDEKGDEAKDRGPRAGMKRLLMFVAQTLGTNGTLVIGAVLLALFVGFAAMRVVGRPRKTGLGDSVVA